MIRRYMNFSTRGSRWSVVTRPGYKTSTNSRLPNGYRSKHSSSSSSSSSSAFIPPPFKPPPISARLRPLIPFFIYWSAITSLAVHLLRTRIRTKEEMDHSKAQISVLQGLINRFQNGELVSEEETQRELEMVGLRERTILSSGISSGDGQGIDINDGNVRVGEEFKELRDVGWFEVIFGQKRRKSAEEEERQAQEEWTKVVKEATNPKLPPALSSSSSPSTPERKGNSKRASSSNVYL